MKTENRSTLHEELKAQTIELHKKAHTIPYISNLLNNDIQLNSYIGHVHAFSIIYEELEKQILNPKNEVTSGFLENYSSRVPLLQADLEYLKAMDAGVNKPEINHAKNVANKILLYSKTSPYKLLGFIYTLDGSLNGGSILRQHLIKTFQFENNRGTMYLSILDDRFKKYWTAFIHNLNSKITENQHKHDVTSASREIFLDLIKIYEALLPIDEKQ
ncbi:MAG TPA: biliverdin-producing heme oxygenase [Prolixibacteraceae bacterium]|nr:biliverdin-producing heme oxygenase [Prolixibacteraceae bacterium]